MPGGTDGDVDAGGSAAQLWVPAELYPVSHNFLTDSTISQDSVQEANSSDRNTLATDPLPLFHRGGN